MSKPAALSDLTDGHVFQLIGLEVLLQELFKSPSPLMARKREISPQWRFLQLNHTLAYTCHISCGMCKPSAWTATNAVWKISSATFFFINCLYNQAIHSDKCTCELERWSANWLSKKEIWSTRSRYTCWREVRDSSDPRKASSCAPQNLIQSTICDRECLFVFLLFF